MKDSINLANMLRRFTREKEEMRTKKMVEGGLLGPATRISNANVLQFANPKAASSNNSTIIDLTTDPAIMSLLRTSNNDLLQDMMGNLDFGMLDSPEPLTPAHGENDSLGPKAGSSKVIQGTLVMPPPLPSGLPGPLMKRIEDLRAVRTYTHQFVCNGDLPVNMMTMLKTGVKHNLSEMFAQASRQFDKEGRKKFFTLDMNNILLE